MHNLAQPHAAYWQPKCPQPIEKQGVKATPGSFRHRLARAGHAQRRGCGRSGEQSMRIATVARYVIGSNPAPEQHEVPKCIKMEGMQLFDRITWNPNQMNGQPCIRGMRLTVRRVVEAVAIYPNRDDLFRNYPELEPEDVRQALAFAAASLEDSATESNAA